MSTIQHLIRVPGLIIALILLLAVFVGPVQASGATAISASDAEQAEDAALVCLTLVGGTALLAGGVWIGKMRRMLP